MSDTPRLDQSLAKATREYLALDQRLKAIEKKKKAKRDKFFELATKKVKKRRLTRQRVEVIETPDLSVEEHVAKFYPTWSLEGFTIKGTDENGTKIEASLVENPHKAKFTYVNHELGKVFGRTYEMRGAFFDAGPFVEDHPELAARCVDVHTKFSYKAGSWALDDKGYPAPVDPDDDGAPEDSYVLNEKLANKIMAEEPETVAVFQRYSNPGTLNLKITAPRDVKEEELSE